MTRWLWAAAILGAALNACEEPTEAPPPPSAPVTVQVVPARRGDIDAVLTAGGETAALTTLRLASPVAGRVTMLAVQPGDRLTAGAVAARVLPLENEATLHGFGVLANAGALGGAEAPMARRLAGEIRDVPLSVPFAATVADRLRNPGEQVVPNDVLLELFDPRSLVVVAQVPLQASADVHPGQPVDVNVGGVRADGQVSALVSTVSPQALTVSVRIALAQPMQPPLLHAAAVCRITVARHRDALLIPRPALLTSTAEDDGTVMVAANGVAARRHVTLGLRAQEQVEVTAGLVPGELVVTEGGFGLPDGTAIAPQPATVDAATREPR